MFKEYISKFAFTLAEMLIVISIVGLVAEMTIPVLVQDAREKVAVVKVKKIYSVMSQAFQLAVIDYGGPESWDEGLSGVEAAEKIYEKLAPSLRVQKYCGVDKGCFPPNETYKDVSEQNMEMLYDERTDRLKARFVDGSLFALMESHSSSLLATFNVDINGDAKPNTIGKDLFTFVITADGVYPIGDQKFEYIWSFTKNCLGLGETYGNGDACTAWVVRNENMDYLRCKDLAWDGKKTCK